MKGLKDKVCGSKRITSIRIPSSEPFIMFINIRVLRLCSTDWKSSLTERLKIIELFGSVFFMLGEARWKQAFHTVTNFTLLHF